jgi:hypothetical protein
MSKDKSTDDHLKDGLPFSALYRKASEAERCPDDLAARILAAAGHWSNRRSLNGIVKRLQVEMRSRYERHRILFGTILPVLVAIMLVIAFQMLTGNDTKTTSECRGSPTTAGQSLNQSIRAPGPELRLDQFR